MHSVRLSFENDAELEQSTIFLRKSHPLNYTAAVKKSQVRRPHTPAWHMHAALCTRVVKHTSRTLCATP
jgi:hypothetical protein